MTIEELVQAAGEWNAIDGFEGEIRLLTGPTADGWHEVAHFDDEVEVEGEENEPTCVVLVRFLPEPFMGRQMMEVRDGHTGGFMEAVGHMLARALIL